MQKLIKKLEKIRFYYNGITIQTSQTLRVFANDKRYVDKSIIACHVYQAGYALIQYTVLDGTSLKSKMNNNYNITNGLLFEM